METVKTSLIACALIVAVVATACSYSAIIDPVPLDPSQSSSILSSDGSLLARLDLGEHREAISLEAIAPELVRAVVAIEDHRYFDHDGVDLKAILRALREDVSQGAVVEGGSTITQQYVRNVLLTREQTPHRKLEEAILAVRLERSFTKEEILERYLNEVYFGNGAYGAQAAADRYFAKPASDLTLAESALLAGLLRAPSTYDPFTKPDEATARRNRVIDAMLRYKVVSEADAVRARATPLKVSGAQWSNNTVAPHFVDAVKRWFLANPIFGATLAEREHLLYQGGLKIETTLDTHRQELAESAIASFLDNPSTNPAASLVAIEPETGHVVSYVGGRDYWSGSDAAKFDLAGQALRPTGSTFKPFVLLAAIATGVALDTQYEGPSKIKIPITGQEPWVVRNYDEQSFGKIDLVEATVHSVNTVFAQLIADVSANSAVQTAAAAGVRSLLRPYPSAALGSNEATVLDVASAYSTFASDGLHVDPVFVTKVVGPTGEILYSEISRRDRVFAGEDVRILNHTLEQVVTRGTGINARIGRPVAGKTGTGQDYKDAWFVGSTPQLTTAVWLGFIKPEPMLPPRTSEKITGGGLPTKIWARFMAGALAESPILEFPLPELGLDDPKTGLIPASPIADVVMLSIETARDILEAAGYQVTIMEIPNRQFPPGVVLAQLPEANTAVIAGSSVTLTVAGGEPETLDTPNLLGLFADEVLFVGGQLGVNINLVTKSDFGVVRKEQRGRTWQQSPAVGARIEIGSTIKVWINPTI